MPSMNSVEEYSSEAQMDNDADMISELPDAVLVVILSLLPLKQAARAAILARRWRLLYAEHMAIRQELDFVGDFRRCHSPHEFVDKVNNYLQLSAISKVKRFLVSVDLPNSCSKDLHNWVAFVVNKGVEALELDFTPDKEEDDEDFDWNRKCRNKFALESSFFSAAPGSLRTIGLTRCDLSPGFDFAYLGSSLRCASFDSSNIETDDLKSLLSLCPVLESLYLSECKQIKSVVLNSNSLKELVMVQCWEVSEMVVSAPNLRSFQLNGNLGSNFTYNDISGLEDVQLAYMDRQKWDMLRDVSHVKTLTLCYSSLLHADDAVSQEPYPYDDSLVRLNNLTELQLVLSIANYEQLNYIFHFFGFFLTPLLERIFIYLQVTFYEEPCFEPPPRRNFMDPQATGPFVNLKSLKVTNFYGTKQELKMLLFFLERAPVLERLVLVAARVPSPNAPHRVALREKVASVVSRALLSPMVELVFCEYSHDLSGLNPTHVDTYV